MPAKLNERVWNALIPYTILGSTYQRNKDRGFYQQLTNYSPAESLQIQFTTQIKGALFACKMENRFSSISPGRTIDQEILVTIDYDKTVPTHLAVSNCLRGIFNRKGVKEKAKIGEGCMYAALYLAMLVFVPRNSFGRSSKKKRISAECWFTSLVGVDKSTMIAGQSSAIPT